MIILSVLGMLASLSTLIIPKSCGFNCSSIISQVMPYIGIFYFAVIGFFAVINRKKPLIWLILFGVGTHFGLISYSMYVGMVCHTCFLVFAIQLLSFWFCFFQREREYIAFITQSQALTMLMAAIFSFGTMLVMSATHNPDETAGGSLLNDETTEIQETITGKTETPQEDKTTNRSNNTPPIYTVNDLVTGATTVDISKTPLVFWNPNCDHCHEIVEMARSDVQYIAIWIRNSMELALAQEMARKHKIDSLFVKDMPFIEVTPSLLTWENGSAKLLSGSQKVIKTIKFNEK